MTRSNGSKRDKNLAAITGAEYSAAIMKHTHRMETGRLQRRPKKGRGKPPTSRRGVHEKNQGKTQVTVYGAATDGAQGRRKANGIRP